MALMRSSYEQTEQMADEHEVLLAALASGSPERAEREMRLHLEAARRRLASIMGDERGHDGGHDGATGGGQVDGSPAETGRVPGLLLHRDGPPAPGVARRGAATPRTSRRWRG